MRYKIGDKVRVRSDLGKHPKNYSMDYNGRSNNATDEMLELKGKIVIITSVDDFYKIEGNSYNWTDEMFEGFEAKKGGIMQKLTDRLKRCLNKELGAIYKMGWIDGDLKLTDEGKEALLEMLLDKHEVELASIANEKIKEMEVR